MKHSCDGFNHHIGLGGYRGTSKTVLTRSSGISGIVEEPFYLGMYLEPHLGNNTIPFQWVHRLTGETFDGKHIRVDVDTGLGLWKVYHLSSDDLINKWMAQGSMETTKHSSPKLPTFHEMNATLTARGSFSKSDSENKHMYLNVTGLDLWIPNHWHFREKYNQQPFLRVFNTTGMDPSGVRSLLNTEWTPKKHTERMVMRTTNFGTPMTSLHICVREETGSNSGLELQREPSKPGIGEEMFVPLAIIQAFRTQWTFGEERDDA